MAAKMTSRPMDLFVTFDFKVVCSLCSVKVNEITYALPEITAHQKCSKQLLLAKAKRTSKWRPVSRRPMFPIPSQYAVCWFFTEGSGCKKHRNRCTFARSQEEAAVWTFLKRQNIDLSKFIVLITESERIASQQQDKAERILTEFSGEFLELCEGCFHSTPSIISGKRWNDTCSADAAHVWSTVLVHHLTESNGKEVYNQIRTAPPVVFYWYCDHVKRGSPCWHKPTDCQAAHSEVEMAVWLAESGGLWSRHELLQLSRESQLRKLESAQGAVLAFTQQVAVYCKACLITLSSHESFFKHCTSLEHAEMISGDLTTEYGHRAPPHGRKAEFWLCDRPDICVYGANCVKAHSVTELEEWLMRANEDNEIMRGVQAHGLMCYRDRLLDEYRNSSNEVHIMSEQVDDVTVTFDEDLCVDCLETGAEFKWSFQIKTERFLAHVALLKQEPGASFFLEGNIPEPCTYSKGEHFCSSDMTYDITVSFKSIQPGLYEQWLVLDFDMRPVLRQKLKVTVGQQSSLNPEEPPEDNGIISQNLERWHRGNKVIIPCLDKTEAKEELLNEYKPPQISFQYKPLNDDNTPMNRENYKDRMHSFLYSEELAEHKVVSRLNVRGTITLSATLDNVGFGMKIAPPGELFCAITVPYTLTPNTPEGWMLRRNVQSALIAPVSSDDQNIKVYEAIILRDATSENKMHLQLSKRCCSDLQLQESETREIEVQFQLNRLKFCEMHKAIDLLPNTERVLPDFRNCTIPVNNILIPSINAKQQRAINFIVGESDWRKSVAPLLIYGPFGTGKTFTLFTAARELIQQSDTRILICTHTNSSADLYVKYHFHPHITSGHHKMKLLRIKENKQGVPVNATDEITRQYCLLSEDGQFFLPPDKTALDGHRVVIATTAMARQFYSLKLPVGYFTHILIDEASQMLECEALMPLGLAGPFTQVVLAGDHMQMGPKLFSVDDRQRSNHTLLNRLFHYYQGQESRTALRSRIIFNENYRSTKEIVDFVSINFYVGKSDVIKAVGDVPGHPESHALRFHHVRGEAHLEKTSMSWFNMEEAACVVTIVQNLLRDWPLVWGILDQSSICVLSEGYQVTTIRKELRKIRLGRVTVENIANVQGKQFRAIVMTAVQTRDNSQPCVELFNDARVLNTAMTRAQSQVIVVGDAAALCYFGKCSRIWRNYIDICITKGSAAPKHLTDEFIEAEIKEIAKFQRSEYLDDSTDQSVMVDTKADIDAILQELQEEQNDTLDYSSDAGSSENVLEWKGLYDSDKDQIDYWMQLTREQSNVYKRGELVMETRNSGYVTPFGNPTIRIYINGRRNLDKSFDGDEVVVEVFRENKDEGKVLGVVKAAESRLVFACTIEDEDANNANKSQFHRIMMVPLNDKSPKICTLSSTKNQIPIWKCVDGQRKIIRCQDLNEDIKQNVFMVELYSWKTNPKNNRIYPFPLGNVIDIVTIGSSVEEALSILDSEYQLETSQPTHVLTEPCNWKDSQVNNRQDLRKLTTFTVDSKTSRDLDDAISVIERPRHYEIGVHIADVASFVKVGDSFDDDAKKQGATYYSHKKEPKHMFQKSVANSLSLLPGEDRMVISLVLRVDKETHKIYKHIEDEPFQFSKINSDRKLSYEEAEAIISKRSGHMATFGTLEDCVAVAYCFASEQRKARFGPTWRYRSLDPYQKPGKRRSHLMIEELNVLFNHYASEYLMKKDKTKNCITLRCQEPPDTNTIIDFKEQHKDIIPLSIQLRRNPDVDRDQILKIEHFLVLTSIWKEIVSAAGKKTVDTDKIIDLIATDDIYPQLLPVIFGFRKCLKQAYVIRSNSSPKATVGHYSLRLKSYIQASSPLRRYMDVILQRLLHSALCDTPVQYSPEEIDILGQMYEEKYKKASEYEKKAEMILCGADMRKQNALKLAFVVDVEVGDSFKVSFPFDSHSFPDSLSIQYRDLQLEDQPLHNSKQNHTTLKWKRRVYSVDIAKTHQALKRVQQSSECTQLSPMLWLAIVDALDQEKLDEAKSLILSATTKQTELSQNHAPPDLSDAGNNSCRTTEGNDKAIEKLHNVVLTLELKPGDTLQVQMMSEIKRGYWTPVVQLVCIKPTFEVCVNHAHSPITCFSERAKYPSKSIYNDTDKYREIWSPLCEMESASNAVDECDSIVIEDLELEWKNLSEKKTKGSFDLPLKYIKEWAIECNLNKCLLCIRKRGLEQTSTAHKDKEIDSQTFTWVAHGVTTNCEQPRKNCLKQAKKVHFYINHWPMETTPKCVFQKKTTYTVEIIPKLLPDIRKEMAVKNIVSANELVQKIALGQKIPKDTSQVHVPRYEITREEPPEGLPKLNESQYDAVEKVLNSNFTVIQGPPGTGKTVVGVYIVNWLVKLNSENPRTLEDPRNKDKKEVILYCGPSNKSVDVVAEKLMKFGDKLKPLRVCGRQMEMQEYPYPGSSLQWSSKTLRQERSKPELRGITLHHRIRYKENPHSGAIKVFDNRITAARESKGEELTDEEVEEYKELLNKARVHELKQHNVILCTCTAASTPNLIKTVSARQILIDECAMATEPQALIPLVHNQPEKVVLIGDHKQLRPIIKNKLVRKLGMSKSLFERYFERNIQTVMLDTQYRMDEDICKFPSKMFYEEKLKTFKIPEPPNSVLKIEKKTTHTVFVHITGKVSSLVVSTEKGNENSKANKDEKDFVVLLAKKLVEESKIDQGKIAILSPYNAQVSEIKKALKAMKLGQITVTTITKSQGSEWHYILLSTVCSLPSEEIEIEPDRAWQSKHLGFVADPNQINVAITRAKVGLCIVGNQELLSRSNTWRRLLEDYTARNCVTVPEKISVRSL
ncbi:hypothetical protein DPEC_G00195880 [Dallia pectoralis]|uniref:Uncharacterized protein n=1 Tax=Dallia pectoralis TaxID=75939 RepID=A0ACC2G768_DALPE|nr:hypothetical protein DPEC_G00195880 [Dallia pectoralis]